MFAEVDNNDWIVDGNFMHLFRPNTSSYEKCNYRPFDDFTRQGESVGKGGFSFI